jgi:hypothetical protein
METETLTKALTKLDITALRSADDVRAFLHEGNYYLRAYKRKPYGSTDPWAEDKAHQIACSGYTKNWAAEYASEPITSGYASLAKWECDGIWQILRAGDEITLCFNKGGITTDNHRNVGYVGDSLVIEVHRGEKVLHFLGDTYSGPDNTARICR